ncbi:MAG: pilus assembly FimT family protein [Planctomycetota bacterium]
MRQRHNKRGFTLIELLIVVSIIGLATLIVLPAVGELFAGQAYVQAQNLIDAKLRSARGLAIRDRRYTGVHVQRHHETGEFWVAVVQETTYNPAQDPEDQPGIPPWDPPVVKGSVPSSVPWGSGRVMRLAEGTRPSRLPTGIGVGFVASHDEDVGDRYESVNRIVSPLAQRDRWHETPFTTFTVLFDPDGHLVGSYQDYDPGDDIAFAAQSGGDLYCDRLFSGAGGDDDDPAKIWVLPPVDPNTGHYLYAIAMCLYETEAYDALLVTDGPAGLANYLNENARFLPVAPSIGGLIRTPVE